MTINDLVVWSQANARSELAKFLPLGRGTERGALEVELANSLPYDLLPVLSDPGAEWSTSLGPAEKLLHDLLSEDIAWPEDLAYEDQIAFVENLLQAYQERG